MLTAFPLLADEITSAANTHQPGKYEQYEIWHIFFEGIKEKTNMLHKKKAWTKTDLRKNLEKFGDPVVAAQHKLRTNDLFKDCISYYLQQISSEKPLFEEGFFQEFEECLLADFGPDSRTQTTTGEYTWLIDIIDSSGRNLPREDKLLVIEKILNLLLLNALLGPDEYLFTALGATEEIIDDTPPNAAYDESDSLIKPATTGKLTLKGIKLPNGPRNPFESTEQEWFCDYNTIIIGRRPNEDEYAADIAIPICSVFHNEISRNHLLIRYNSAKERWEARNVSQQRRVIIARKGEQNPDYHLVLQGTQAGTNNSCNLAHGDIIFFDNPSLSLRVELSR